MTTTQLEWVDEIRCRIDGVEFVCTYPNNVTSRPHRFAVQKLRPEVDRYVALVAELAPRRILEIGAWSGGSAAMLHLLARPERLAVVDVSVDPAPALDAFVAANHLDERIHRYWGTDQSDGTALASVIERSFGQEPLDLVIDDASHLLGPTRESFARTFPHLRPGGIFVVEDWSHDHFGEAALEAFLRDNPDAAGHRPSGQGAPPPAEDSSPLSIFALELLLAAACRPDVVRHVSANQNWLEVTRGEAPIDPDDFSLGACVGRRGRVMVDALEAVWPGPAGGSA